jgi:titin
MLPQWKNSHRCARLTTPARRARLRSRFRVEHLETRELLSAVFNVTRDDDTPAGAPDVAGTLRYAIDQANLLAPNTPVTIDFSIGTGQQTIALLQPLPTLANPITIDGTTQNGYVGKPLIQVDGSQAGAGAIGFSLDDDSHNSTIKALEITDFDGGGILDDNGNANVFTNDVIGLHVVTGLARVASNGTFGIEIRDQANGNTISNVVVAGNRYNGIVVNNSMNNTVTGSEIGSDASGEASLDRNGLALGNGVLGGGGSGIVVNGSANHNTISNNIIVNNQSFGVYITDAGTSYNVVVGNHIGIDKAGTTALGNVLDGVALVNGANFNSIGQAGNGNVISGNGHSGVWINGVDNVGDKTSVNTLAGNLIGTNAAGTAAVPNALDGVVVNGGASVNSIGSPATGTGTITQIGGNVISGNSEWGVYISDSGTNLNAVQNDYIGTDITGKSPVPNAFNGLDIVYGAQFNTVGGTTAAARNLISGNLNEGVLIGFAGTSNNVVEGNFIGTDVTGKAFLAGQQQIDGVYVGLGAGSNTIGGQNPVGAFSTASWNVISGNSKNGVLITDSGTTGTVLSGNFIGTDVTGTTGLPNGDNGVTITAGTSNTTIGAETSGSGNLNVISGNLGDGISITGASVTNVSFNYIGVDLNNHNPVPNHGNGVAIHGASGNRVNLDVIRNNGGYGILTDSGSSHNAWYYDSIYGNTLGGIAQPTNPAPQPAPALTSAVLSNGQTTITGTITGSPYRSSGLVLQFYASPASTAPASIQGLTFIGQASTTTDANGNASFTVALSKVVPAGEIITATSDYAVASTSVFSNAVTVVSTATFLGTDTTTEGAWRTAYGADGYDIAADTSAGNPKLPSYATLSITGAQTAVWAASTTDPRALQNSAGSSHIASTWYSSTSMSFNLNLTDGQSHEVSLYAVDFDNKGRKEQVQVIDAGTGTVLSTQTLSSFAAGLYLSWSVTGNVVIKVTNLGGPNAVISGLFFGGRSIVTSATFLGTDTTTQGKWHGVYGADGYDIAADKSTGNPKIPTYATLSITGAQTAVWAASTTDPRALQNSANTGSIASAWYSSSAFSFNLNLTDGKLHKVSLYAVDFDNKGRKEQVQIIDAASGMVLSTQTVSSFQSGDYLSWNISGNVVIKVTNLSGPNAVVSGLFLA